MKINFVKTVVLIFFAVAIFACKEDNFEKLRQNELEKLSEYLEENFPDIKSQPSGLFYIEVEEGTGDTIQPGDRIQIFYSTWTIDSVLIDETQGYTNGHKYDPYEFVVGQGNAITGLEEAATYMQKGTKAHLILPSELAYGQNGTVGVAGFTTLLMEVEVHKIYQAQTPGEQ